MGQAETKAEDADRLTMLTNAERQRRFRERRAAQLRDLAGALRNDPPPAPLRNARAPRRDSDRLRSDLTVLVALIDYLLPDNLDVLTEKAADDGLPLQRVLDRVERIRHQLDARVT